MSSVDPTPTSARIIRITFTDDRLSVQLEDGRRVDVPLGWYPRLAFGSPAERANYEISGAGYAVHWPELDEDLGIEGLIAGKKSRESPASFARWLFRRYLLAIDWAFPAAKLELDPDRAGFADKVKVEFDRLREAHLDQASTSGVQVVTAAEASSIPRNPIESRAGGRLVITAHLRPIQAALPPPLAVLPAEALEIG